MLLLPTTIVAQTQTVRDTATAYGARLNAKGQPANLNPNRINSRIPSRIDSRLSLRVERYQSESTADPIVAFRSSINDNTRVAPSFSQPQQLSIDEETK